MKMIRPTTPFPTTGYYGPLYFCDRKEETDTLISNINGGQSTTLVAIRRIGKTGLIKHLQHLMSDKLICIYTDILPTENSIDFLNSLTTAILNSVPEKTGFGKKIWNFIKSLRPVISFDSLSGEPNVTFNVQPSESEHQIESLFAFLEKQNERVLFAIDEFQQILNYPEKNVEAWLRRIIQQLKNVVFIFSGSQQHLMNEIFTNPAKPFFRSTQFLKLDKIDVEAYQAFIQSKFLENRKSILPETVAEMLEWTNVHTYYVQLLCNRVFINSGRSINTETWHAEALKILKEQEYVFFGYRDMLTKQQWNLLKAIATEGKVYNITSKDFMQNHKLGSPSTVNRSVNSLLNKELIFKEHENDGRLYYSVYDVLFQRWIQNL
ncbi:AAA family ATPase [Maribellus sediminis]|uniref:AAA family ATPase n=1 Tax=Maribellus sediminis TaxID=2696285 RepID=UPI001981E276|nr:ATP-binding protein [Maribellus sediminis]